MKIQILIKTALIVALLSSGTVEYINGQTVAQSLSYHAESDQLDEQVAIKKLLSKIEQQEKITFLYDTRWVDEKFVSAKLLLGDKLIVRLGAILKDHGLTYAKISRKSYAIKPLAGLLEGKSKLAVQTGTLRGVIRDGGTGETLPGANVFIEELDVGTSTGTKGEFVFESIETGTYTINATFLGFQEYSQSVEIIENEETFLEIELQPDLLALDEIVVNALGFEEQRDEQGVSTANVQGEDIARSGEQNLVTGLSAKAAGVQITNTSGDPGAGARIQIRGARTLGNNQPLFIVDGVPLSNQSAGDGTGGVVQQSRINDLNPQDIASVEILKGPSAAALWGSRAANGVVVITTKKGKRGADKIDVTVSSSLTLDQVNSTVPLQRSFGQGRNGEFLFGDSRSWGDNIAGREGGEDLIATDFGQFYDDEELEAGDDLYDGFSEDGSGNVYYVIPDGGHYDASGNQLGDHGGKRSRNTFDHSDELYGTGVGLDNSISVSGGDERSRFYLNIGHLNQQGIVQENSNYERTSFRINADRQYSDWFRAGVNVSYIHTNSDRVQQGSNTTGVMLGMVRTPPDFNNKPFLHDYTDTDRNTFQGLHRSYRNPIGEDQYTSSLIGPSDGFVTDPGFDNPFWTIRFNENNSLVNRVAGKTELELTPTPWLSITERIGIDFFEDQRFEYRAQDNATEPAGTLQESVRSRTEINSDLIVRASQEFNENFSGTALLGWNLNHREGSSFFDNALGMVFRNVPRDIENFKEITSTQNNFTIRTAAYYGKLNVQAYDQLFMEVTGRYESASTFGPEAQNSFFYPSGNIAWQFTDFEPLKDTIPYLSFGKLRFSYGEAGIQPGPYQNFTTFFPADYSDAGFGSDINSRQYGNGFSRSLQLGNAALVPEVVKEYEFGGDFRFWNDRIQLNLTRYSSSSTEVILDVDIAPSSGFGEQVVNSVELENDGYEAELDVTWLQKDNFSWNTYANWSKNNSLVTDLAGVESIELAGISVDSRAAEGRPFGVLWGGLWMRNDDGSLLVNDGSVADEPAGFPVEAVSNGAIGDPNPDWSAGIGNTFRYKNASLNVLFDIRQGGDVWNGTRGVLYSYGTHEDVGVETFVPADQADGILNYDGDPVSEFGDASSRDGMNGFIFRGRLQDWDGNGPAPTVALDEEFYRTGPGNHFNGPAEQFVEDGGFVRLREVSFSYRLNTEGFRSFSGLSSIDFGITGRNLLLWTDYSGIDPETNLTGTGNGRGMDYFNNPSTRSLVFSLKVNY
jgi:TonB-linked SusC/RagA family outer membrane protein